MGDGMNRHTRAIPILVDNGLNRAIAIKYAIFSLFGLTGIITAIPSITELSTAFVAQIVSAVVFLSAGVACVAAWNSAKGDRWERVEIFSGITFISFATIYAFALIYLALMGDDNRVNAAVLTTALLVIPVWRVRYLIRKNKR